MITMSSFSDMVRCTFLYLQSFPITLASHSELLMLSADHKERSSTAGRSDVVKLVFHREEQQSYLHVRRPVLLLLE